ncbi:zinc finger protein 706-like isoform X1 [Penaeus chinensis]|uniref:zinc finger protein 706-like isoform X1 n=2 Tax=Penaeus chinensis TaxID=139456 RepID=UPI001FB6162B|nr:zinc finger protein 706-like isoform X1 [Penaeus chinensis]
MHGKMELKLRNIEWIWVSVMARGHQKAQSQAKALAKQAAIKSKQGHNANAQKKAAAKALTYQCPVCRSMMPDPKTFKQHFENKHPGAPMPEELKDI